MTDFQNPEPTEAYLRDARIMQSGVAAMQGAGSNETEGKHLRVGLNSIFSDQSGLVDLLISKGLFTKDEYFAAIAKSMAREREPYEQRVKAHFGQNVRLGEAGCFGSMDAPKSPDVSQN